MINRRQMVRMILTLVVLGGAFGGLGMRLGYLHLGANDDLRARVQAARKGERPILVGRGRILDRRGQILAMDLTVYHVNADPKMLIEEGLVQAVGAHLARALELDRATVTAKLQQPARRQVYIAQYLHEDDMERVKALKLPHVWFEPVSARYYPQNNLMAHVIGFSNADGVGSAGVEMRLDRHLKGVPGVLVGVQDGRGRELPGRRILEIRPQAGADVQLTLDVNLEAMVEAALDRAMQRYQALGAWAILEEVRTGRILAMSSRPDYDLNEFRHARPDYMLARPIGFSYEPGSTFKMAVVASALNEGLVRPETTFDCEHGTWIYRNRPLRDFHPYGTLSVADILKKSSNIGAAKIATLHLGENRLDRCLREFGIGRRTGLELPGEEPGYLAARGQWDSLTASRVAMGHSVMVTALQMLNIACALGNNGFLMRSSVVERITDPRGHVLHEFEPAVVSRPVREETARLMCRLMARVTEEGGTGRRAAVPGYSVAGKTGTAVKVGPNGYDSARNIASFVGLVPAEAPLLGLIVVVDEPQPEHTGGVVAAPVFQEIAKEALRYLDIAPSGKADAIDPGREEDIPSEEAPYVAWAAL